MTKKTLGEIEEPEVDDFLSDDQSEEQENVSVRYEITHYGIDFDVAGYINRLEAGDIAITEFQRGYVWTSKQASTFIESLLLGLPVPGVFLYKDKDSKELVVVDGRQRLTTLLYFAGDPNKHKQTPLQLTGLKSRFEGMSYQDLDTEHKREFDNFVMHATIVKQDKPEEDDSSTFELFRRINTGGSSLTSQEIRSAIYQGKFNDLLKELNLYPTWRKIFSPKVNKRMKDEELILRFFALFTFRGKYEKPMREFLNQYMRANRNLEIYSKEMLTEIFTSTIDVALEALGKKAFRPRSGINFAAFDAITVAIASRISEIGKFSDIESIDAAYQRTIKDERFSELISGGTSDEANVEERINIALKNFAKTK